MSNKRKTKNFSGTYELIIVMCMPLVAVSLLERVSVNYLVSIETSTYKPSIVVVMRVSKRLSFPIGKMW